MYILDPYVRLSDGLSSPEGPVDEGAAGGIVYPLRVGSESSRQEGGSQVDCDTREPDHEGPEEDALRRVHEKGGHEVLVLLLFVLGEDRGVVEDCCQHVHSRDCHQEKESRLHLKIHRQWERFPTT